MSIYIQSFSHISTQEPLNDQWFDAPHVLSERFNPCVEPDYRNWMPPMETRRMGKLLKRAVTVSLDALQKGQCEMPDAIISGTGLGCVENTEKFLNALLDNDEECLPPTPFMQSTHNTIGSQIALKLHCHGYNCTYSHRGTSFDHSLLDAFMQMQLHQIHTALVGGFDEMTPDYFNMLGKIGYWRKMELSVCDLRCQGHSGSISGSTAASFLLSDQRLANTMCEVKAVEMFYGQNFPRISAYVNQMLKNNELKTNDIDAVVMGLSGDDANDELYRQLASSVFHGIPVLWYKHLFGESFCASAFGLAAAAECLSHQRIPTGLLYSPDSVKIEKKPRNILVYNHFNSIDHSLILVTA